MTARSILVTPGTGNVANANATDTVFALHGNARSSLVADAFHYRPPVDVTLTSLAFIDGSAGSGSGRTLTAFLNGSASPLVLSIPDGGSAGTVAENSTDTASALAGDKVSVVARKTGGGNMAGGNRMVIVAPGSRAVSPFVNTAVGLVLDNSTRRFCLSGNLSVVNYDALSLMTVRSPGDWRGLFTYVSANAGSGSVTVTGRQNNADTALSITIGPGETGYFFDNTNVVSVSDGDDVQYIKTGTTGASVTVTTLGSSIVNDDKRQQLWGYANRSWAASVTNAGAYTGLPGQDWGNSVTAAFLSAYERTIGYPAKISRYQIGAFSNSDADVVSTLLINGVPSALTVTTPAGAGTVLVEDAVNEVTVAAGDRIAFLHQSVGATTGSFYANAPSILIEDLTVEYSGSVAGGATASGQLRTLNSIAGSAAATGAASAAGLAIVPTVGSAAGTSTASGTMPTPAPGVGSAAGVGSASGVSGFFMAGAGSAAGISTLLGASSYIALMAGASFGEASAVAVSTAPPPSAVGAKRLITVEITAAIDETGAEQTFYFADARFTTQPTDTPANVSFDESLSDPGSVTITVFGDGRTGGGTKLSLGEIKLKNPDGQYDGWLDYGFDGRRVVIRRGIPGAYPADFETVFTGTIRGRPTVNTNEVVLSLLDKQHIFDRPLLVNRYGGTNVLPNGIDGTADDRAGQAKPRLLGRVFNEAPPCVNTSKLVFQISDGPITSVEGVYDRGEPLVFGVDRANSGALLSTAPAAGSYDTCLAEGLFRLGADPEGEVTFGATQGAAATDRTAAQLLVTLALEAGVLAGEIADADATDLASDAPAVLGLWVSNDGDTFAKVMDRIAESVGGFYGFDPAGVLRMGRLVEPAGDPVLSLEEFDILSIERRPARDGDLPTWAYTVRHSRVGTVQTSDLAPAVDPARRAFLGAEYRAQRAEVASVKAKYLLAAEGSVDTALTEATDGANEASRRQALHGVARDFYDVTVKAEVLIGIVLRLTSIVEIIHRRFGLSDGRLFVLLGIRLELARNRVTLTLWG